MRGLGSRVRVEGFRVLGFRIWVPSRVGDFRYFSVCGYKEYRL